MLAETFDEWEVLDRIISEFTAEKGKDTDPSISESDGRITLIIADFEKSCNFSNDIARKLFIGDMNALRINACDAILQMRIANNYFFKGKVHKAITLNPDRVQPLCAMFRSPLAFNHGHHGLHDSFIRWYVGSLGSIDDSVGTALQEELHAIVNPDPRKAFIQAQMEGYTVGGTLSRSNHNLALFILLKNYPPSWGHLFAQTYTLLCSVLKVINDYPELCLVYPPNWTQEIFRLENSMSHTILKGVIFGADPMSQTHPYRDFATGYAFTFQNLPEVVAGDIVKKCNTMGGLVNAYGFPSEFLLNGAKVLEKEFGKKYNIALVNFIRTIFCYANSGSANAFNDAWSIYNLAWLESLPQLWDAPDKFCADKVLVFQNESGGTRFPSFSYSTHADFVRVKELLAAGPHCIHPTNVNAARHADRIATFAGFLRQFGADGILHQQAALPAIADLNIGSDADESEGKKPKKANKDKKDAMVSKVAKVAKVKESKEGK